MRPGFEVTNNHNTTTPDSQTPTIVVLDAFTSGGAQNKSDTSSRSYLFGDTLMYNSKGLTMKGGIELNYYRNHAFNQTNFLGTYTFSSLANYHDRHAGNVQYYARQSDTRCQPGRVRRLRPDRYQTFGQGLDLARCAVSACRHICRTTIISIRASHCPISSIRRRVVRLGRRHVSPAVFDSKLSPASATERLEPDADCDSCSFLPESFCRRDGADVAGFLAQRFARSGVCVYVEFVRLHREAGASLDGLDCLRFHPR